MKFDNIIILVIFLVVVSFGGLLAGMVYFNLTTLDSTLRTINFDLPIQNNASAGNLTDFQDILSIVVYPILGLKESLPYLTYFMVFAFVIALAITAYLTSKNPVFFVVHLLFTFIITYFCMLLSNMYKSLISQPFINQMMINFTIYNKLMFYLPQIVFLTSLIFGVISFINIMKPQSSNVTGALNYGGDY